MHLRLNRRPDDGTRTLGTLTADTLELATVERPWLPNPYGPGGLRRFSCVPPGIYQLIPHSSADFPRTYALVNEALGVYYQPRDIPPNQPWGRDAILIHIGNRVRDVVGCVGVGLRHGAIDGEPAAVRSRDAMRLLNRVLGRQSHSIEILED